MEFNIHKCVYMRIGTNNNKFNCNVRRINLKNVELEKDLGIIIGKN